MTWLSLYTTPHPTPHPTTQTLLLLEIMVLEVWNLLYSFAQQYYQQSNTIFNPTFFWGGGHQPLPPPVNPTNISFLYKKSFWTTNNDPTKFEPNYFLGGGVIYPPLGLTLSSFSRQKTIFEPESFWLKNFSTKFFFTKNVWSSNIFVNEKV